MPIFDIQHKQTIMLLHVEWGGGTGINRIHAQGVWIWLNIERNGKEMRAGQSYDKGYFATAGTWLLEKESDISSKWNYKYIILKQSSTVTIIHCGEAFTINGSVRSLVLGSRMGCFICFNAHGGCCASTTTITKHRKEITKKLSISFT